MPQRILIDFDSDDIHKIQNFGEDLFSEFSSNRLAAIDIALVDRATNRLCVVVTRQRYRTRALRVIKAALVRHYLTDVAHISEESIG